MSIEIPESVTDIEVNAFTENNFPSSYVVSILNENATVNDMAFDSTATVAQEGTDSCFEISSNALSNYYCIAQEVTVPDSVTSIEDGAFEDKGLTSVTFPSALESIGNDAFKDNDLTDLTLPATVTDIEDYAFDGNPDLELVVFTNPGPTVGIDAFSNGHAVETTDVCFEFDSTNTDQINDYYDNENNNSNDPACSKDVVIPQGVTAIGDAAFQIKSLTSVIIPSSVISIGDYAFEINSLASVIIPDSVVSVGTYVFQNNSLTSVTLGSGLTSIAGSMFRTNSLGSIEIPNTITSIEVSAFRQNSLASVTIPSSVISIGGHAFLDNSLTSVVIGSGITSIGVTAFEDNPDLSSVCIERASAGLTLGATPFPNLCHC